MPSEWPPKSEALNKANAPAPSAWISDEAQWFHCTCEAGRNWQYALLPGDPARSDRVAKHLDNPRLIANNREHRSYPVN